MSSSHWNQSGHLLGLENLPREHLLALLSESAAMLPRVTPTQADPSAPLDGVVATLFFENSTRTRMSFTLAARRLGLDVLDLNAATSSTSKGESLLDTARNIEAMGVDGLVIRCSASGGAALIAGGVDIPVINAGDGRHEHPTQGLLDALTLQRHLGRETFDGMRVGIVGDIASSRVARSNVHALTTLGADVVLVGPPALVPEALTSLTGGRGPGRIHVGHDLDAILPDVDALMMLRVQFERHGGSGIDEDYTQRFGLTCARAARLADGVPVLHPGPVNRGTEIDPEVADGPRSLILDQVTCGVAVRMAVLQGLLRSSRRHRR